MSEPELHWRAFALAVGAIATLRNGGDPQRLCGFAEPEAAAAHLRASCELGDREAVIERLRFLFEKGHSALWLDLAEVLTSLAHVPTASLRFEHDPGEWTQSHEQAELVRKNPEFADVGLVAWDMGRLSNRRVHARLRDRRRQQDLPALRRADRGRAGQPELSLPALWGARGGAPLSPLHQLRRAHRRRR